MRHRLLCVKLVAAVLIAGWVATAVAQEGKKPVAISPSARLAAAKTAFIRHGGGSEIPYNAVLSGMEGWARFTLVDSPEKADIVVEVTSPSEGGGVSVSSSTSTGQGKRGESTTTTRELPSGGPVKLNVYDAHSRMPLWSASEPAKSALRQKAREDNLLQAGQRLVTRFRERLEPPPPPQ
jgi:hypothetical protein